VCAGRGACTTSGAPRGAGRPKPSRETVPRTAGGRVERARARHTHTQKIIIITEEGRRAREREGHDDGSRSPCTRFLFFRAGGADETAVGGHTPENALSRTPCVPAPDGAVRDGRTGVYGLSRRVLNDRRGQRKRVPSFCERKHATYEHVR